MATVTRESAMARLEREVRAGAPKGKKVVFGKGDMNARLVLVGEAPGREEEVIGRPFVGPAGHLLDVLLAEAGLERDKLWITNLVKWRPTDEKDDRSRTRVPNPTEVRLSEGWLKTEFGIIEPEVTVCLGNLSARALIGPGFKMTVDHGKPHRVGEDGVALGTFHPAYVLRLPGKRSELSALMCEDLKRARSCLR